jgi:hypothetical protein
MDKCSPKKQNTLYYQCVMCQQEPLESGAFMLLLPFDFYLRLGRVTPLEDERRVFDLVAKEAHQHLQRLTRACEHELADS